MKFVVFLLVFVASVAQARVLMPNPPEGDKATSPVYTGTVKEIKPTDVVGLIKYYSKEHGIGSALPLAIAKCESGYREAAKNPRSTASGPFQFLKGTRSGSSKKYGRVGESVWNMDAHVDVAIQKLKTEGPAARNASKHCRKNLI